jgi:hypothetical protein
MGSFVAERIFEASRLSTREKTKTVTTKSTNIKHLLKYYFPLSRGTFLPH